MFVFCAVRLSRLAVGLSLALVLATWPGRSQVSDPAAEGQPLQVATTFGSTKEMLLLNNFATLESTQDPQTVSL